MHIIRGTFKKKKTGEPGKSKKNTRNVTPGLTNNASRRRRKFIVIVCALVIFCVTNVFFSSASGLIVATLPCLAWRPENFRQGATVSFLFYILSTFYSLRPRGCLQQNLAHPFAIVRLFFVFFPREPSRIVVVPFLRGKIRILFPDGFAGISFHFDLRCSARPRFPSRYHAAARFIAG